LPSPGYLMRPTNSDPPLDAATLIRHALRNAQVFNAWPSESINKLVQVSRLHIYRRGEQIWKTEPACREVLAIISGCVEISRTNREGTKFVKRNLCAGDTSGFVRLLAVLRSPYDYQACEESYVAHLPSDALMAIMDANPLLWRSLALFALERQRDNLATLQQRTLNDLGKTMATLLCDLAASSERNSSASSAFELQITQGELASRMGLTRQTVNRLLAKLSQRNLVQVKYGRIEITDMPGLCALAAD